jgi:hypothetical protein
VRCRDLAFTPLLHVGTVWHLTSSEVLHVLHTVQSGEDTDVLRSVRQETGEY